MLISFEVMEDKRESVAAHYGDLGLLVALGYDWDMLRDMVNESVASTIGDMNADVEIAIAIDEYHRTRFKHHYGLSVADIGGHYPDEYLFYGHERLLKLILRELYLIQAFHKISIVPGF